MILLTVGIERYPFDRLVRAFDDLFSGDFCGHEAFAQIGTSVYEPRNIEFARVLPFSDVQALIAGADVVVSHAGAGSLISVERLQKPCLVVPRRRKFGEHVDDHQLDLAQRLEELGKIRGVQDMTELGHNLSDALSGGLRASMKTSTDFGLADRMESIVQTLPRTAHARCTGR